MNQPIKISEQLSAKMANMAFFASMLVVLMHAMGRDAVVDGSLVAFFVRWVRNLLTFSAVPYFFIAAGFFLAGHCGEFGWWRSELIKRVRTLLVPYLFWVVVGTLLYQGPLLSGLGLTFGPPKPTHIWFLRALMLLIIASPIVCMMCRKRIIGLGSLLILFCGSIALSSNLFLPMLGVFCFSFGFYLRLNPICVSASLYRISAIICAISLIPCSLMGGGKVIVPLLALFVMWVIMPDKRYPIGVTSLAFPIYLLHPFIYFALFRVERLLGFEGASGRYLHIHLSFFIIAFLGSLGSGMVLKRYAPRVAGIIFGGR